LFLFFVRQIFGGNYEQPGITIELRPVFLLSPVKPGTADYITPNGDTISINRFRFYISEVILNYANGEKFSEAESFHLVDASDPQSLNIHLKQAPEGRITSVSFNIGIDSATSVSGALSGALDPVKGMYWAWNSGYINAKLEGSCKTYNGSKKHPFEFHIGGYMQPYYALRKIQLNLPGENIASGSRIFIYADASAWLAGIDLKTGHSVMIPGKQAMEVADRYSRMFSIKQ
jgi:hypothetical protein